MAVISMERRSSGDRRHQDIGPPAGWCDRRHSIERRQPHVGTVQVSDEDWERYFGTAARGGAAQPMGGDPLETAASVFDRVRD